MHVEQNVLDNLLRYLIVEVQKDMQEAGVHQHLWLQLRSRSSNYFKLVAPYVFR